MMTTKLGWVILVASAFLGNGLASPPPPPPASSGKPKPAKPKPGAMEEENEPEHNGPKSTGRTRVPEPPSADAGSTSPRRGGSVVVQKRIGGGHETEVYEHPLSPQLVIKIPNREKELDELVEAYTAGTTAGLIDVAPQVIEVEVSGKKVKAFTTQRFPGKSLKDLKRADISQEAWDDLEKRLKQAHLEKGFMVGDLKPDAFVYDADTERIYLVDFGYAEIVSDFRPLERKNRMHNEAVKAANARSKLPPPPPKLLLPEKYPDENWAKGVLESLKTQL